MGRNDSDKRKEHMVRRKVHGLSYRDIAEEFGTSKSTAHRHIAKERKEEEPDDER